MGASFSHFQLPRSLIPQIWFVVDAVIFPKKCVLNTVLTTLNINAGKFVSTFEYI